MGMIQYTAEVAVRLRSPYSATDFYGQLEAGQVTDVAVVGSNIEVMLDWGYTRLDPVRKDVRFAPSTPTGHAEVISHGWREGWIFQVDFVDRLRDVDYANDFEALRSLNSHLSRGQVLWTPDYENHPDENVWVIAEKVHAPRRFMSLEKWSFKFEFMELPAAQLTSSLPSFASV